MITRRFGRTGIAMPVLSCGGMRYQHKWDDVPPEEIPQANQDNLEATVRRALELGINHIETARGYGTSEMQLGRILPAIPRDQLIVQTKVAPTADPKGFLAAFDRSMEYLRLDHVDLLSIHGINNRELLEWTLRPGGCLDAASRLQGEGRCLHIGFSTHAALEIIREAIASDAFDYVNLHWYWVNDRNWPAVGDARDRDMGVFIISPTDKGGRLQEPPEKLVKLCAPLSPMAFNDLHCLMRPEVHTLSIGAALPGDFDEHVRAVEMLGRADELVPPIAARLRAEMEGKLGRDWLDHWQDGLPEWEDTPGHIHIREILRVRNYAKSLDMVEFAKSRHNLLGNAGHWFPGENTRALDSHDLRHCLARSPFPERVIAALQDARALLAGDEVKRLGKH